MPKTFLRRLPTSWALSFLVLAAAALPAAAVDVHDTRMLQDPALSAEHVAFVYAGDLWIARRDGSGVRRLTAHAGSESGPRFSPDGSLIAFTGEYDGNTDVYVVPVEGGSPRRLTWHPGNDVVADFTPDGEAVLFTSPRSVHTQGHRHLYTVAVDGGFPERLPVPNAYGAAWSPDGARIAYLPDGSPFRSWKRYRGGTASRIWVMDLDGLEIQEVPRPEGRSNDTAPMWIGERVYFLSDRAGELNLFSFDPATEAVEQLTFHEDFPVLDASAGDGRVVYEQAGYLHLFDPEAGTSERLVLGVAHDLVERRPRWEPGAEHVRGTHLSPSGARAVFGMRGEIVTVPAEHGSPRNLTGTPGVHERSPAWSPDGRWVAYVSDASGEYALHVAPRDGRGEVRTFEPGGAGFYEDLKWSPDGEWISFTDNSWALYVLEVATGRMRKVDSEPIYGPVKTLHHAWSPDSRWLAYTKNTPTYFQQLWIYSVEEDRSRGVTEGLSDVGEPVFDAGGKYLYVSASTDAGPIRQWFAQSNTGVRSTNTLYLAVLPADEPSPLAPRNDEEEAAEATAGAGGDDRAGDAEEPEGDGGEDGDAPPDVRIDFDGLAQRIVAVPVEPAAYRSLQPGKAGTLYYLKARERTLSDRPLGRSDLARFSLDEREEETLVEGVGSFVLSADGEKVLFAHGSGDDRRWEIAETAGEVEKGAGRLAVDQVRLHVDPTAEWEQMFYDAWRIQRDYFYDPGMHGADWPAMRDKYADFLPHLATRGDLTRVLRWLGSELTVGHLYVGGGDSRDEPDGVPGGLLGADLEIADGRYRFARVYGGLNWNPDLRAPLTEPGVDVREGEYLLAVEGRELRPPDNPYAPFEYTAGQVVEITVGPSPGGSGARTVEVVPIESESGLRNRAWVEGNLERVHEATDGRVAYVYVPNTAGSGHTYFRRYFYPQAHKEAIIVDERYNSGGQVADYYIEALQRPAFAWWAMRYGRDLKTPLASIQGPKVMIIDQHAGSGGDMLPWMFRKLELGTLVGKRTWGGLVGILGFPPLMDGGFVTAPNLAIWTEDGWVVENEGVPPDVEVEQLPAEVAAGRDPQLERAIEIALEQLEASPPGRPERPEYPDRAVD
ncbi:MAG: PDZ domain-containing protein [Thermoanaerobaculia bacterium]